MGSVTRRKVLLGGTGKEKQGREASLYITVSIIGWFFSHIKAWKCHGCQSPCIEAVNYRHESCLCIFKTLSALEQTLSQLRGDKSSTIGLGTRVSAAAKYHIVFSRVGFLLLLGFAWWPACACLNNNRIFNVPKFFHTVEQAWGGNWACGCIFSTFFLLFSPLFIFCDFVIAALT